MLRVVCAGERHLTAQDIVDTNAPLSLYLLLRALFVLFAHVHDGGCRRTVILVTVHALEVFLYLFRHASMLSDPAISQSD